MNKKRILLIADAASMFTYEYVQCMIEKGMELVIVDRSFGNGSAGADYYKYYEANNIKLVGLYNDKKYSRCMKLIAVIRTLGVFDVCHIMYFSDLAAILAFVCINQFKQVVVNYWGSDLYVPPPQMEREQKFLLDYADQIIVCAKDMKQYFLNKYPDIKCCVDIVHFNGLILPRILKDEKVPNYDIIPTNNEKLVVAFGYSGNAAQQHLMFIELLKKCSKTVRDKIYVIFTMTYGLSKEYYSEVVNALADVDFEYKIVTDYMTDEQVISLRQNTDVFVYAELTDAFSASMQEYIYCQAVPVIADWLSYPLFDEYEVDINGFSNEEELLNLFSDIVEEFDVYKQRALKNKEKIRQICDNKGNVANWEIFYKDNLEVHKTPDLSRVGEYLEEKLEEETSRPYYYDLVKSEWFDKRMKDVFPLRDFVENNKYTKVLIYGAGTLGEYAYLELKGMENVEICVCDKFASKTDWYEGEIIGFDSLNVQAYDVIIVTPVHIYEQIENELSGGNCYSLLNIVMNGVS
ncbi:MAG: hypothetical protein IJB96_11695 [Lachnospira sp.]|nr:hypothetical protein [Lachnospira sp.]